METLSPILHNLPPEQYRSHCRTVWAGWLDGTWTRMVLPTVLPGKEWRMAEEIAAGVPLWVGEVEERSVND